MEKNHSLPPVEKIRDLDYAAWARVNRGKNTVYVNLHAVDVAIEALEPGDYVLVKLVKVKKHDPFARRSSE